jgi:fructose-bisphosphate aldolase, class I
LGGVVFLSGGQSMAQAFINLNRIEQRAGHLPFGVTFSYMRALQDPPLHYWAKHTGDVEGTHKLFNELLTQAGAARAGTLDESIVDHEAHHSGAKQGFWEY